MRVRRASTCQLIVVATMGVVLTACESKSGVDATISKAERPVAQWSLDSIALTDIPATGRGGSIRFELVTHAVRLNDATIVVADRVVPTLRFFDSTGRERVRVGRHGDGPGEFRNVSWLGRCGADTLFAYDPTNRRMTVVTTAAHVVRQFPWPDSSWMMPEGSQIACSVDGTVAWASRLPNQRPLRSTRDYDSLGRRPANGRVNSAQGFASNARLLRPIVLFEIARVGGGPLGVGEGAVPLGRSAMVAVGPGAVFAGEGEAGFDAFANDGNRQAVLIATSARTTTSAHYEASVEEIVARYGRTTAANVRRTLLALPMPPTLPSYSAILADPSGLAWVVVSAPGDSSTQVRVFDRLGTPIAVLTTRSMQLLEVGADYALGLYDDDADVQHVAAYRLRKDQ